ncbi:Lactate utilization protein C [archaeon HR06]|nr:Lactate utilization protein C [archaeon HR06]
MKLYLKFKEELEKLGGEVYSFKDLEDILKFLKRKIEEENIKKVALARLDKFLEEKLYSFLKNYVEVVKASEIGEDVDMGITGCDLALANTGSIVYSCEREEERLVTALPNTHIIILSLDKIAEDLEDSIEFLSKRSVTFITGPSKTADILGQIIMGAHGPRRVIALVLI